MLVLPVSLIVACSPAGVVPDIGAFSKAVVDMVDAQAETAEVKSLDERVAAARRQDFANMNARYALTEGEGCNAPDSVARKESFSESCSLIPMALDKETGEIVTLVSEYDTFAQQQGEKRLVKASDQDLLREFLASELRSELARYAGQIQTLAMSKDPGEVSSALGNTFDSLVELGDAAQRYDIAVGSNRATQRAANRNLFTTFASEALEARRYSLLQSVVKEADPFVRAATEQLAAISLKFGGAELDAAKDAFNLAVEGQETVSVATLEAVEARYADLSKVNSEADFQKYLDIGRAHAAIVTAFAKPESLEQLTAANARIRALSEAIRAAD